MIISANTNSFYRKYKYNAEIISAPLTYPTVKEQCVFIYALKNDFSLVADFERINVSEGSAVFLPPRRLYSIDGADNSEAVSVSFSKELVPAFDEAFEAASQKTLPFSPSEKAISFMMNELVNKKCADIFTLSAAACLICGDALSRAEKGEDGEDGNRNEIVKKARDYMKEHYKEKLSLDALSKIVGTNPSYLSRMLSSSGAPGFSDYLDELRFSFAERLLCASDAKISEIAKSSGIGSLRSFDRKFLERYGVPPTEYRKRRKNNNE